MMMSLKPGKQQHIGQGGAGYQNAKLAEQVRQVVGKQEHNSRFVGYLPTQRELVTNSDIFDKKLMAVKFTALVCKQLRTDYNHAFNDYKKGIN